MTPTLVDHLVFAALVVLPPVWTSTAGYQRLRSTPADTAPRVRLSVYRTAIALQWSMTLLVLAFWLGAARPLFAIGLVPRVTWGLIGVSVGLAIMAVVVWRQRTRTLNDDDALAQVRRRLGNVQLMIPRTPGEMRWFAGLAVTAGVCEEVLYRGYLIWYLSAWMPPVVAVGVAAVVFGLGHVYQGPRGVVTTGLVGGFLGLVYLQTGSLLAAVVIHITMDLHSGHLGFVAFRREHAEPGAGAASLPSAAGLATAAGAPDAPYDAIVVGLGAMGSAALYHLARSGLRVLGIEQFESPHVFGSSHGETRIIRDAYFEDPRYVPLVQRAFDLWSGLERESGRRLLVQTGGVMIGPPGGPIVEGALRSAREHGLAYELLDAPAIRARFPSFAPRDDMVGVWEPRAGVLFPEACVAAHLAGAAHAGAIVHQNERVTDWSAGAGRVHVTTDRGTYTARRVVFTAGAWAAGLLPGLALPLEVERVVLAWFEPLAHPENFAPERCPVSIWEYADGRCFYAFPSFDGRVKAALHHQGEITHPDRVRREATAEDVRRIRDAAALCMPDAAGPDRAAAVCMYTNTPDENFILDRHPMHREVVIASPCSGHGFKFSSAIGELIAKLVRDEPLGLDIELFRLSRFESPS